MKTFFIIVNELVSLPEVLITVQRETFEFK